MTGSLLLLIGFALMVAGIALWSVPAAYVFAGVLLFIAGGLDYRQVRS